LRYLLALLLSDCHERSIAIGMSPAVVSHFCSFDEEELMLTRCNTLFLCGIILSGLALVPAAARAQAKAEKEKVKSADELKFEVYPDSAKQYRWRLVQGEDKQRKVLATGGQ